MAESSKGFELLPGEEHKLSGTEHNPTGQATSEMTNVQLGDVPNVEVRAKGAPVSGCAEVSVASGQSTGNAPCNQLNSEQQMALEAKMKKEQAKKYFSLRVRPFCGSFSVELYLSRRKHTVRRK